MGLRYALALILWHGKLKSSTMTIIVDSDMFGTMTRLFIDVLELTLNASFQVLLGDEENSLGCRRGL